jgi:hypothetical protein
MPWIEISVTEEIFISVEPPSFFGLMCRIQLYCLHNITVLVVHSVGWMLVPQGPVVSHLPQIHFMNMTQNESMSPNSRIIFCSFFTQP